MEECTLLTEARRLVEKEEMHEWETRHSRDKKKKKGDVGTEKEKEEEEGERLANFFYTLHDFLAPINVPANIFVPAELPARYAIDFVPASAIPAVNLVVSSSAIAVPVVSSSAVAVPVSTPPVIVSSSDYSVVSSANFILPACIEPTPLLRPMTSIERPEASNTRAPS